MARGAIALLSSLHVNFYFMREGRERRKRGRGGGGREGQERGEG